MMGKKKILIVVPSFTIGGTIVSLNSLLSVLDTSKYKIDVFALNRSGEYLHRLPNCTILPENVWLSHHTYTLGRVGNTINGILRIIRVICRKFGFTIVPLLSRLADKQLNFSKYDTVVNYDESVSYITCHYPAARRVAWVHCDYRRHLSIVKRDELKIYEAYDKVVCVSEYAKRVFVECIPTMASRTLAIHNIINVADIKHKASERVDDERFITEDFTIISAGRLDPIKQFHLIPQIAADLKIYTNKKYVWYIIGGERGFDTYLTDIKRNIERLDVSEQVVLLGEKKNLYPYMSQADLYVSTSLSESFPLVINEAKALGIPVLTNNFGSAGESVKNGIDGWITTIDDGKMARLISEIITSKVCLEQSYDLQEDENRCILKSIYEVL